MFLYVELTKYAKRGIVVWKGGEKMETISGTLQSFWLGVQPTLDSLYEKMQPIIELSDTLNARINSIGIPQLPQETVYAIREISVKTDSLRQSIEEWMQNLNVPAVQSKITKPQIEEQIQKMDDTEKAQFAASLLKSIRLLPASTKKWLFSKFGALNINVIVGTAIGYVALNAVKIPFKALAAEIIVELLKLLT